MGKRYQGIITQWKDEQGFGFITPEGGGERIFVHIRAFAAKRRPVDNEPVSYELGQDDRGRPQALRVLLQGQRADGNTDYLGFILFFALVLIALAWLGITSWWPPAWYLGLSLAAYLAYALDKQAARQDQWRTKESTLHLLALFGGWPGALVAQHRLRHKSRKTSFRVVFWLTVALNLLALAWLLSAPGARMLQSLPLLNG